MLRIRLLLFLFILLFIKTAPSSAQVPKGFVRVKGNHFVRNAKLYTFLGTNFWYGLNLGSKGPGGNRKRLVRELDRLASMGVKNLRIVAGSEGPDTVPYRMLPSLQTATRKYNEDVLEGLDFLLANDPRGVNNREAFLKWIDRDAGLIKQLDPHHLVTTGSEGNTSSSFAGTDMVADHQSKHIDYKTIHIWVQNWGYYDQKNLLATYKPALE